MGDPTVELEDWEQQRLDGALGVISTIGRRGTPHSAPVAIRVVDGSLQFQTNSDSIKLRNIEADHRVAVLVYGQPKWGVMIQGTATVLSKGQGAEQALVNVVPEHKASWRRKEP
ncbi:MAG: pyridoxamine 5'-phosphate oxidase family protein [Actinomycetota bacterium]